MKSFIFDLISMAIVALLVYFYLGREIESFLVFAIGLFSLRQVRRYASKKDKQKSIK
jgi:hypothetical protein